VTLAFAMCSKQWCAIWQSGSHHRALIDATAVHIFGRTASTVNSRISLICRPNNEQRNCALFLIGARLNRARKTQADRKPSGHDYYLRALSSFINSPGTEH